MSLFDTIKNAIFHSGGSSHATSTPQQGSQTASSAATSSAVVHPANNGAAGTAQSSSVGAGGGSGSEVDVEKSLDQMNSQKGQSLNWRTSIVDLMKLVGLDSSLQHRQELAKELGFSGDASDSAKMNIWLHKSVMQKLAQNGGKVPQDLLQ